MSLPVKKRRRLRRALLWSLTLIIGVPGLYLLAAFGLALVPVNKDFVEVAEGIDIQVVSNGVHVGFLVPLTTPVLDWSRKIPREDFPKADEHASGLLFGWGDRGIYIETPTWSDLKLSTALNAIFWPSASVVHVEYYKGRLVEDEACRTIRLSDDAYRALCAFIEESFRKDPAGKFILIPGKGYRENDNFYESKLSYHAFNTCNLWANRGLKRIGVRTALWSPFAGGIMRHLPKK